MRETEMRRRIERALAKPLHRLLLPVLGLGLASGGCALGGSEYGAPIPQDARGVDLVVRDGSAITLDAAIDAGPGVDGTSLPDAPTTIDSSGTADGDSSHYDATGG
jgi:hypothetical protein